MRGLPRSRHRPIHEDSIRCVGVSCRTGYGRLIFRGIHNKENDVRERLAYLLMIGMLLVLVTLVFAVIGKGEYQPPPLEKQERQGSVSHYVLL